jgi:hypothetical protein
MITDPGSITLKDLYCRSLILNEFKHENAIKMETKLDSALLGTSYLIYPIKLKNDTKIL